MNGDAVVIGQRFNGPPRSGHGGYSAGCAGTLVDAPAVEATLRKPPPLETPLSVSRAEEGAVGLLDGEGEVVVTARPAALELDGPEPVTVEQAALAAERFAWVRDHPFPTCFGCGPQREPSEALCLYTGPVGDGRFAVDWTPPGWAGSGSGEVEPLLVWAALDCPSSAPVHGTIAAPVVLGRYTVALEGPVRVGEPHVIQSWMERTEGRKRHTAVVLFTGDGERLAAARAVWVELARPLGT